MKYVLLIALLATGACSRKDDPLAKPNPVLATIAEFSREHGSPRLLTKTCQSFQVKWEEGPNRYSILINSGGPEYLLNSWGDLVFVVDTKTNATRPITEEDHAQAIYLIGQAWRAMHKGYWYHGIVGQDEKRIAAEKGCAK